MADEGDRDFPELEVSKVIIDSYEKVFQGRVVFDGKDNKVFVVYGVMIDG